VSARDSVQRFDSTNDLEALLDLDPHALDGCRELLAYSQPPWDNSAGDDRRSARQRKA
jgi:hypothetical protein